MAGDWLDDGGRKSILLSGAAGSNIGLFDAGYMPCPTAPGELAGHLRARTIRGRSILVVPGLVCRNGLGEPNTMRGEETQVLGWLAANPGLGGPASCAFREPIPSGSGSRKLAYRISPRP